MGKCIRYSAAVPLDKKERAPYPHTVIPSKWADVDKKTLMQKATSLKVQIGFMRKL